MPECGRLSGYNFPQPRRERDRALEREAEVESFRGHDDDALSGSTVNAD